jgi:hypothetical protein
VPEDRQDDCAATGSLIVEDHHFALVPEWVIDAEISDASFRLYSLLLRYGNGSGCRMPSRRLLAERLHRSTDSIDRALRELVAHDIVRVERRRRGRQNLTNRYYVRTSRPATGAAVETVGEAQTGGRRCAATTAGPNVGGRTSAATRIPAARVAAETRPDPKKLTETTPPPPSPEQARRSRRQAEEDVRMEEMIGEGLVDVDALVDDCRRVRLSLGRPTTRWSRACILSAVRLAVVRGWPTELIAVALRDVASDPATHSPMRLAEAGPWWDRQAPNPAEVVDFAQVSDAEALLDSAAGLRPRLQAKARKQLLAEGVPLSRATVVVRAAALLEEMAVGREVTDVESGRVVQGRHG